MYDQLQNILKVRCLIIQLKTLCDSSKVSGKYRYIIMLSISIKTTYIIILCSLNGNRYGKNYGIFRLGARNFVRKINILGFDVFQTVIGTF